LQSGPHTIDRYGRLIGLVYVDGADAGLQMLRQGLAWYYTRYLPEATADIQSSYRQAEGEAREQRRGLWSDPGQVEPWLYRRARTQQFLASGSPVERFGHGDTFGQLPSDFVLAVRAPAAFGQ
jgi:endonuclease YncB( thermonuclease family)